MRGVFPDYLAPIVRTGAEGRELATARWGMPSSSKAQMDATKKRAEKLQAKGKSVDFKELLRMEPDGGTTNIRNVKSKHWTRWLGAESRCVVIRRAEGIQGLSGPTEFDAECFQHRIVVRLHFRGIFCCHRSRNSKHTPSRRKSLISDDKKSVAL